MSASTFDLTCPVCDSQLRDCGNSWRYVCPDCGVERSNLVPGVRGETDRKLAFDLEMHLPGIESIRRRNYEKILDVLAGIAPLANKRILDVGCGPGWFPEAARRRGMDVLGVEPDLRQAEIARSAGNEVIVGYFPEDVPEGDCLDIVVFNDVFEHLVDVAGAVADCHRRLKAGGLLVLNLPSRKGFLYRIAIALDRLGLPSALERLWQKQFPSPHLSYFCPDSLARLVKRVSFDEISRLRLPAVERNHLWTRIQLDRSSSPLYRAAIWLTLSLTLPFLQYLPADVSLQIFRKRD